MTGRPALRYHGGKWKLADWIIGQFPPHRVYVEPFGGAASVLLRKPRSYAEVYNDTWDEVVTLFRVLRDRDQAAELERLLRLTPFARMEWTACRSTHDDPVERARRLVVRSFQGFGSASCRPDYRTGWRSNSNRSGTTPAIDWRNYPEALPRLVDRLQGVTIECRDATEVMKAQDGPDTLHYVDPPYVHETRSTRQGLAYAHELGDTEHETLLAALGQLTGMVIVSGYRCGLYDNALAEWHRIDRNCHADGARPRTESLWLNPSAIARRETVGLFDREGAA